MNFKKFSVKALALVMTLAMLVAVLAPVVSAVGAAKKDKIVLVSLGDSMANGYGFDGYHQDSWGDKAGDFVKGDGGYGYAAYSNQFAEWLGSDEGGNHTVTHHQLAVSAMRPEDLLYLLGVRQDEIVEIFNKYGKAQVLDYTGMGYTSLTEEEALAKLCEYYQESIKEADIITMGVGNASFGAYLMDYIMNAVGVFGEDEHNVFWNSDVETTDSNWRCEEENCIYCGRFDVTLEDALVLLEDEAEKKVVLEFADTMKTEIFDKLPAEMLDTLGADKLERLYNGIAYVTATFIAGYELIIDRIIELNSDVEIIMVGLMNTLDGLTLTGEGMAPVDAGEAMDSAYSVLNAYIAALPTVKQLSGEWTEATFYYAAQPHPQYVFQAYKTLQESNWAKVDCGKSDCPECLAGEACENGRLVGSIVRKKNLYAYNSIVRGLISPIAGFELPKIYIDDVEAYEYYAAEELPVLIAYVENQIANENNPYIVDALNEALAALKLGFSSEENAPKEISIAFYLGLEAAIADNIDADQISVENLMALLGGLEGLFDGADKYITELSFAGLRDGFHDLLNTPELAGLCKIYGMFKAGNGIAAHPTPAGHDALAKVVIETYSHGHTAQDETKANVIAALGIAADYVKAHYNEALDYAYAHVTEKGYVALANEAIDSAIATLEALDVITEGMDAAIKADVKAEIARTIAVLAELKVAVANAGDQSVADFDATVTALKAEVVAYLTNVENIVKNSGINEDVANAFAAVKSTLNEVSVAAARIVDVTVAIDAAVVAVEDLHAATVATTDAALKAAVDAEVVATVAVLGDLKAALLTVNGATAAELEAIVDGYKADLVAHLAEIEALMAEVGADACFIQNVRNAVAVVVDGIVPAVDCVLNVNAVVSRANAAINVLKSATANTDASFKAASDAEIARTLAVLDELALTLSNINNYATDEFVAIVDELLAEIDECVAAIEVLLDEAEAAAQAVYAVNNTAKAIVREVLPATDALVSTMSDIVYDYIFNKMGATYDDLVAAINAAAHELNPARLASLNEWLKGSSSEVIALLAESGDNVYVFAARLQEIMIEDEAVLGAVAGLGVLAGIIAEYYDEAYAYGYNYALMNGYVSVAIDAIDEAIAAINNADLSVLGVTAELEAAIAAELALTAATLAELKAVLQNNSASTVEGLVAAIVALSDDLNAHANAIAAICEQAGIDVNVLVIVPFINDEVAPAVDAAIKALTAYYADARAYVNAYVDLAKGKIDEAIAALEALNVEALGLSAELSAALKNAVADLANELREFNAILDESATMTLEELVAAIAAFELDVTALVADVREIVAVANADAKAQVEAVLAMIENDVIPAVKDAAKAMEEKIGAYVDSYVAALKAQIATIRAELAALNLAALEANAELKAALEAQLAILDAKLAELEAFLADTAAKTVDEINAFVASVKADINAAIASINLLIATVDAQIKYQIETVIGKIENELLPAVDATINAMVQKIESYVDGYIAMVEAQIAKIMATLNAIDMALLDANAEIKAALEAQLALLNAKLAELKAFLADTQTKTVNEIKATIAAIERDINNAIANIKALIVGIDNQVKYQIETVINMIENELLPAVDNAIKTMVDEINAYLLACVNNAYNQAIAMLGKVANMLKLPLVVEFYQWLMNNPEDVMAVLADFSYGRITSVAEALANAFQNFYYGTITGEYAISVNSYYVSVAKGNAAYADLFAAALDLGSDQYSKQDWDNVDLCEIVKADLITVRYNETELTNAAMAQALGFVKNYVDTALRADAAEYAVNTLTKILLSAGLFNEEMIKALVANNVPAGIDMVFDELLANEFVADKNYVEINWAAVVGEENLGYVEQLRAELRAKLIENGVAETVYYDVNALEYILATPELFGAEFAEIIAMFDADSILAAAGDDAIFTVEFPLVDLVVAAMEAYLYNYMQYTIEYAELLAKINVLNPNATVILLGNSNPFENLTVALTGESIDVSDAYDWVLKTNTYQTALYAIATRAVFVDTNGAQTNYGAALEAGLIDDSLLSFALLYFTNESILDLSAAGHVYVKDQIMNAMTITCAHNFAPATCTQPQICTLCGATNGSALGHHWVDADCENPRRCVNGCGSSFGAPLGHKPGAEATCTTAQTCTVCNKVLVEALGHTLSEAASCTEPQTCTVCGITIVGATGHVPGAAATCTTAQTCTVCDAVLVAALGHTAGAAATCTTAQNCTVCGEQLVAALGHTASAAANCTTAQTCTVCGEVLVAALGHTYSNDCDADCNTCGATRTPAAHIAGEWVTTKEATKKAEGIKSTKCVVCGAEMTQTIPMLEKGLSTGGVVAIVVSSVVVLGGGAAAAWFFIIKKKRIV